MTKFHVTVASEEHVYTWQYRSTVSSNDVKGEILEEICQLMKRRYDW